MPSHTPVSLDQLATDMDAVMRAAIQDAVAKAGGQSALARQIGTSQALVAYWLKTGRAGGRRVVAIEAVTGVSRHRLRPDIFPPPRRPAKAVGA